MNSTNGVDEFAFHFKIPNKRMLRFKITKDSIPENGGKLQYILDNLRIFSWICCWNIVERVALIL